MTTQRKPVPKRQAQGRHALLEIYLRSGGACGICDCRVEPVGAVIDHIVPLDRGGADESPNRQIAHAKCNRWKKDRLQSELLGTCSRSRVKFPSEPKPSPSYPTAKTHKRPGRPASDEHESLPRVEVRMPPEVRRAVRIAALDDGVSMGEWVRRVIVAELERRARDEA